MPYESKRTKKRFTLLDICPGLFAFASRQQNTTDTTSPTSKTRYFLISHLIVATERRQ